MHSFETKALLLDIEGTTSSIDFVHEVLFPYAKANLSKFVSDKDELKKFEQWIEEDKKEKSLKDLQGLIWETGYRNGDFHGHIYKDAYRNLLEWHKEGISLYIYSSGSIKAQKLLFAHTEYGDLNSLFSGNFDTSIGAKKEASSYTRILEEIKETDICFLSDNSEELKAAKQAGLNVIKLARPQDRINKDSDYLSIESFDQTSFKLSKS